MGTLLRFGRHRGGGPVNINIFCCLKLGEEGDNNFQFSIISEAFGYHMCCYTRALKWQLIATMLDSGVLG